MLFRNAYQEGCFTILYSIGSKPLSLWGMSVRNGHIKRITDEQIGSLVLEVCGTNVSTTSITCPEDPQRALGIKLPFLGMLIKNMKKYLTFEVQVLDDNNIRRRFQASNYHKTTRVTSFLCTMPLHLDDGWNLLQFSLADFTKRAYGTRYVETLHVTIHANCRLRHVFFTERLCSEEELPRGYTVTLGVGQMLCARAPPKSASASFLRLETPSEASMECGTPERTRTQHQQWRKPCGPRAGFVDRSKGISSPAASISTVASEGDLEECIATPHSESRGLPSLVEQED